MCRAQAGDAAAYAELLTEVQAILSVYLRAAARRFGQRDDASIDDLVQEVLIGLHSKRHTYDPHQPFMPWLLAIARYKMIDAWRSGRRRPTDAFDPEALAAIPDRSTAGAENAIASDSEVERLLSLLPERSRKLLELIKLEGWSVAEAAAASQMTESAVKVSVHRALKTLRAKLMGEA
jgi:RNA polymerase sigma-70 factor (ECF subfamily)